MTQVQSVEIEDRSNSISGNQVDLLSYLGREGNE